MMKTQDTLIAREMCRTVWMQCHVSLYTRAYCVCTTVIVWYYSDVAISLSYHALLIIIMYNKQSSAVLYSWC